MKPGIRKAWQHKARQQLNTRKFVQCEKYTQNAILRDMMCRGMVCRGTYSKYPLCMTMSDLSNNSASLLSGLYITRTRHCEMGAIRTRLHKLQDDFWDILTICGARRQISAPDDTARIAFCSWASSLFNSKMMAAFCQTARDTLTITISEEYIRCIAPKLDNCTANNLLELLGCVALADGLLVPNGNIGDGEVEVTTTDIDSFCVSMTVRFSPSYMEEVQIDEARFKSMYGHIVANL